MAAPPHSSGTGHSPWAVKAGGTSALVNEALTRRGYLVAPPAEFLALLTDWRGAVHGAAAGGGTADRCVCACVCVCVRAACTPSFCLSRSAVFPST